MRPASRRDPAVAGWTALQGVVLSAAVLAVVLWVARWKWMDWKEHQHDGLIRSAAVAQGLPPELVKAVVWRESRFDASARGGKGELGLMQVTGDAAQEWADSRRDRGFEPSHLLDARTNLHAGAHYLAKVSRRYLRTDHPYAFALADYNAGRGNVLRWMKGPAETNAAAFLRGMTFPGTREYVQSILARTGLYREDFGGPTGRR